MPVHTIRAHVETGIFGHRRLCLAGIEGESDKHGICFPSLSENF